MRYNCNDIREEGLKDVCCGRPRWMNTWDVKLPGTLGCDTALIGALTEAKHKGLIRSMKPYLDVRVSDALYLHVLQNAGEA